MIEPWAEITLPGKVSGNLSENMEDWLVENKCININQSDCLFPARQIANVSNNTKPIRVANCSSQTVQFRKGSLLAFAEEASKITNTEMDDKGNKINKGYFEPMNEILKLPEVSLPVIVKQPVITKKKRSELRIFGSLKAERKRTTRLTKKIKGSD